jgi:hypothetical protein
LGETQAGEFRMMLLAHITYAAIIVSFIAVAFLLNDGQKVLTCPVRRQSLQKVSRLKAQRHQDRMGGNYGDDKTHRAQDGTHCPRDGTEGGARYSQDGTQDGTHCPQDGTHCPQDGTHCPQDGTQGGAHCPQDGTQGGAHCPQDDASESDAYITNC